MATDTYTDRDAEDARDEARVPRGYRDVGAQIAIWLAWAIGFGFWAFSMSIDIGIFRAIAQGGHDTLMGGLDSGGASYVIIYVLGGFIALGLVIAYGAARWSTRDKRMDAATEAATARIYDDAQRGVRPYGAAGTRSPRPDDAHRPA